MGKQLPNKALLIIDIQIHFRGVVYELRLSNILKWLGAFVVIGTGIYRRFYGSIP